MSNSRLMAITEPVLSQEKKNPQQLCILLGILKYLKYFHFLGKEKKKVMQIVVIKGSIMQK